MDAVQISTIYDHSFKVQCFIVSMELRLLDLDALKPLKHWSQTNSLCRLDCSLIDLDKSVSGAVNHCCCAGYFEGHETFKGRKACIWQFNAVVE